MNKPAFAFRNLGSSPSIRGALQSNRRLETARIGATKPPVVTQMSAAIVTRASKNFGVGLNTLDLVKKIQETSLFGFTVQHKHLRPRRNK